MNEYSNYPKLKNGIPAKAFLKDNKWYVSPHILFREIQCKCGDLDCQKVDWSLIISPYVLEVFEDIRKEISRIKGRDTGIMINSACRCRTYQKHLDSLGYPAAEISPHCPWLQLGSSRSYESNALDLALVSGIKWEQMFKIIRSINPEIRVGWKKYKQINFGFVHIDDGYNNDMVNRPPQWVKKNWW